MTGWIIYERATLNNKFNNNAFDWMKSEASTFDIQAEIFFDDEITSIIHSNQIEFYRNGTRLTPPDFVLLRAYAMQLAKAFEYAGIRVFNNTASLENCRNKWLTHLILSQQELPQPKTILRSKDSYTFHEMTELLGKSFVVKEIFGSKGEQVNLVNNEKDFNEFIRNSNYDVLCQEFIKESAGVDIRIHVVGSETIVGIKRQAQVGFRSNYALGGTASEYDLTPEFKTLAIQAVKALGLEIAGVDILLSLKGPLICEVNGISGFRAVTASSAINIPRSIFKYINTVMV